MNGADLSLPPGFRFHPTDEELVLYYLCRKCTSQPIAVSIIAEIDLYKHDPWQLPDLARYGEKEWYFFSPRDRKYPNGSRPNRAAGTGYWKATGADKPIGKPKPVGIKKALVFYSGKAPKGEKTNWIMHEYRLADVDRSARKRNSLRLDDWVLCRIYNKKGGGSEKQSLDATSVPSIPQVPKLEAPPLLPPLYTVPPSQLRRSFSQEQQQQQQQQQVLTDYVCFDTSDSILKSHPDSSCSEQVHSSSPDFNYEREVQSQPTMWKTSASTVNHNLPISLPVPQSTESMEIPPMFKDSMMQDIFMYLQKPF